MYTHLNKYVCIATLAQAGVTVRIHYPDRSPINRGEVEHFKSSCSCRKFQNQYNSTIRPCRTRRCMDVVHKATGLSQGESEPWKQFHQMQNSMDYHTYKQYQSVDKKNCSLIGHTLN
jgi:hypothetical protein